MFIFLYTFGVCKQTFGRIIVQSESKKSAPRVVHIFTSFKTLSLLHPAGNLNNNNNTQYTSHLTQKCRYITLQNIGFQELHRPTESTVTTDYRHSHTEENVNMIKDMST